MNDDAVSWPSAAVAVGLLLVVGGIAIAAILRYSVDDALKVWSALGTLVGVITGAVVSYFFTRSSLKSARDQTRQATTQAASSQRALTKVAARVDPKTWKELEADPAIAQALEV